MNPKLRGYMARLGLGVLAVMATAALIAAAPAGGGTDREDALQIFNRDVYWLEGTTFRNPDASTSTSEPLFNALGQGPLATWGEFQRAAATSRMHCTAGGERTDVHLRLSGLIPNGVYSIFYGKFGPDSQNPLCLIERTLALPSKDPDQQPDFASFVADENGEADFHGRVDGCLLLEATQVFMHVIYHYDGQTYGALPNRGEYLTQGPSCRSSFGEDAIRQLVILQKW